MNYIAIIYIIIVVAFFIVFRRNKTEYILKSYNVIRFIFVPYGLLYWIVEILIMRKVSFSQFGFLYNINSILFLIIIRKIIKSEGKLWGFSKGRLEGLVCLFILSLLTYTYVLSYAFLETYIFHR